MKIPVLAGNNYGKSRVRLVQVTRDGERHHLKELTVNIQFQGDFETAHTHGDNSKLLPTDTMKNTVYALARLYRVEQPEEFGVHLAEHFLERNPHVSAVKIELLEHPWTRMTVRGKPHNHSFINGGNERRTALVTGTPQAITVQAGIEDLLVLKTTGSGFEGFLQDPLTTLKETSDRVFATVITARWSYRPVEVPYGLCATAIRQTLIETFADHDSKSVQQTLYAMGQAVLELQDSVAEIHLSLPNKHCLLVNLEPFGMDNPNAVFVPTDEPHGLIEATLTAPPKS